MTAIQTSLEDFCSVPVPVWPFLAIVLFLCLVPLVVLSVHHVANDPLARAYSYPSLWLFLVLYELLRYACEIRVRRSRVLVSLEYDDPIPETKRLVPDKPLDGAEDPS